MAASGLHLGNDLPSVLFRHLLEVELLASQDVAGLLVLDFLDDAKHTITDDIENIVFFKPLLGRLRLVHIETARRTRIRLGKRSQRGRGLREAVARAVSASPLVRSGEGRGGDKGEGEGTNERPKQSNIGLTLNEVGSRGSRPIVFKPPSTTVDQRTDYKADINYKAGAMYYWAR